MHANVRAYYEKQGVPIIFIDDQMSTDFGKAMRLACEKLADDATALRKRGTSVVSNNESVTQSPSTSSNEDSCGRVLATAEIIVLGTLGGRLDQGVGILHELMRETQSAVERAKHTKEKSNETRIWFVSERNISFLLRPGANTISGLLQRAPVPKDDLPVPLDNDDDEASFVEQTEERIFSWNVGILPVYGRTVLTTSGLEWDIEDWESEMGGRVSTSNHVVRDDVLVNTTEWVLFTVEIGKGGGVYGS